MTPEQYRERILMWIEYWRCVIKDQRAADGEAIIGTNEDSSEPLYGMDTDEDTNDLIVANLLGMLDEVEARVKNPPLLVLRVPFPTEPI